MIESQVGSTRGHGCPRSDCGIVAYIDVLYGDRFATFTEDDSQRAFKDYIADAQKRLEHDQQFPDEPKQIRPREIVSVIDGRVQVSGQVAVMAINEMRSQATDGRFRPEKP